MNRKVYQLVAKIPKGQVMTYGQIAKILKIKSAREVGRILHQNKDPVNIPCHRVVFANGRLSKSYAFGGIEAQRKKLIKEGAEFIKDKVVIKNSTRNFF
jgi:methylated-DNA-protein-cysteine methyltransferase-like protein